LLLVVLPANGMPSPAKKRDLTLEERSWTNAQRMARGLPPRSPVFGRALPGRDELPTRAFAAKRTGSSPLPGTTYTGRIQIRSPSTGSPIGYVGNTQSGVSLVDLGGIFDDVRVRITTSSSNPGGSYDLQATNQQWTGSPFIGAAPDRTLAIGSTTTLGIGPVPQTSSGSPPTPQGASAIWQIDPNTKELTAHWVNPDGSRPNTVVVWDARANQIFIVGDVQAYNSQGSGYFASAVQLFLVD
jgi:hypothetical protein